MCLTIISFNCFKTLLENFLSTVSVLGQLVGRLNYLISKESVISLFLYNMSILATFSFTEFMSTIFKNHNFLKKNLPNFEPSSKVKLTILNDFFGLNLALCYS